MPIRSGAAMRLRPPPAAARRPAPLPWRGEEAADVAHGLAQPVAVLDQRPGGRSPRHTRRSRCPGPRRPRPPRAAAWRSASEPRRAERLGHGRPAEHGGRRAAAPASRPWPARRPARRAARGRARGTSSTQSCGPLSAAVAATWTGREGAVVEVGLDPGERADQPRVAGGEADPPARHRVGLGERAELDRDVEGARRLEDRGRRLVVEIDLGIGDVGQEPDLRAGAPRPRPPVEVEVAGQCGRVRGEVQHHHGRGAGTECSAAWASSRIRSMPGPERHVADRGAGDDEAEGVDRVARVGRQDRVARGGDRLGEVGQPLLRAQRDADLGLGVERARRSAAHSSRPRPCAGPGCRARSSSGASCRRAPSRPACRRCARGVGLSGLPMPRSMMSRPAARAAPSAG